MKTSVLFPTIALLALAGSLTGSLAGCHRSVAASGAPAIKPGIVVSLARLELPAVKGNPGAAYFTLGNQGNAPVTLVGVDITGAARTEMHETSGGTMASLGPVAIAPGQQVVFGPGGKHVMAFGLASSLSPGGSSQIVFHFQDGKSKPAPLRVELAGNEMAGMTMGGHP